MKKQEWTAGLDHIDPALVEQYVKQREALTQKKRKRSFWLRAGAVAACFALILSAVIVAPLLKDDEPIPPAVSTMVSGSKITGKQYLFYNGYPTNVDTGLADMVFPGFLIRTVIEAKVIEVLPDTYYMAESYHTPFHVAKLQVINQIHGKGLPEEIYFCYSYYDTTIFEGYDRFIFSLSQVGIENYLLINQSQGRVDYFPNMFETPFGSDPGFGSVIAFNEGTVDERFWEKANRYYSDWISHYLDNPQEHGYPASRDSTIDEVKANIIQCLEMGLGYRSGVDYITAEDLFVSDEAKRFQAYLKPSESNMFAHILYPAKDPPTAYYHRIINGFPTNESYYFDGSTFNEENNAWNRFASFTTEDLAQIPDIGEAMANLDLSKLKPPHTKITRDMEFNYSEAEGFYRKVDDKVYGIIRIRWHYSSPIDEDQMSYYEGRGYVEDDCYYLYDSEGNGSIVEREELRAIIGNDYSVLLRFEYNTVQPYGIP